MALRSRRIAIALGLVAFGTACSPTLPPDSSRVPTGTAGSSGASSEAPTAAPSLPPPSPPPGTLTLVGHEPLFGRGMNAALAISGDRAFIGSRTDGSDGHEHPGILVVDISRPDAPLVVAEVGPPGAGIPGVSTRELRVWPRQDLLVVMSIACDANLHACRGGGRSSFRAFDLQADLATSPTMVAEYRPRQTPHEFFLWIDPDDSARALLFVANSETRVDLSVLDISAARTGHIEQVATWSMDTRRQAAGLHSLSVSPDGRRAYVAFLAGGFFVLDTSAVARGDPNPEIRPVGSLDDRLTWAGVGPHSAVAVPGRTVVLTTDEVYGGPGSIEGCPWGWTRLIDIADAARPTLLSEYRVLPWNDPGFCDGLPSERDVRSTFTSHNPTVTEHVALVTWHAAGLQVIDTTDARAPRQLAAYVPKPLESVITEDPRLTSGLDRVAMWSYPIIRDGLIHVVDVRNGFYVLSYDGPLAEELSAIAFLEGNSNVGVVVETPAR